MATTKQFRVKHGLDASNNLVSYVSTPVASTDAATKGYVDLLVANTGGGGASLEVSNTAPLTGNTGDIWYDSNTGVLFVYNEGAWIQASIIESTGVSNNYLTSTYVTNTTFQSAITGLANTLYVDTAVASLVNSAPTTLNTLVELSSALGNDENFSTTVTTLIGEKTSNAYVTSTYVTNTVFNSTVSQYLQVANIAGYIPANTSTTSASLSGNTVTFTRADSSTFDLDLSAFSGGGGGGGGASVTASATPPVSPALGDLWYDTDTGVLNVYYDSFWVEVRASSQQILIESGATAPTGGVDGLLWYNTNTSELYAYYGTSWVQLTDSTIPANTSTTSASLTGNTVTFTRADSSTYDLDLSAFSPDLTGYANTLYVDNKVASIVNSAPTTLNTLVELSNALGNDENFSTTITTLIGEKAGNSYVTSTYVTNTVFNSTVSQYLQVANVAANTSTSNAVYTVANSTLTFTRADNSTFDLLLPSASVEVANVAPVTGNEGDMWFDTTTGVLNVYLDGFWVESSASASDGGGVQVSTSNTAPLVPGEGDLWFDPSDATLYIHRDNVWVQTVPISLPANTSTASASLSGNTATFTRANGSSFTLDLTSLKGQVPVSSIANTAPSGSRVGDLWYDTFFAELFMYNGSAWVQVTSNEDDLSPDISAGNTSPSTPAQNDLWFDTSTGVLNIYYDGYWVEAAASASGTEKEITSGAFAPVHSEDTLWYNTTENIMYISANGVWEPIGQQANTVNANTVNLIDITVANSISFSNNATLSWNDIDGTVDIAYGSVTLQVGQEQHYYVKFTEAVNNGDVIMFAGAEGDHALASKADMNSIGFIPEFVMGVATESYSANDFGYVTSFGKVRGIDTRNYGAGALLYLSANTPGLLTTEEPPAPADSILIAASMNSTVNGVILVRPTHKPEIDELHGVDTTGKANNDVLVWNTANSKWEASSDYATKVYVDTSISNLVNNAPQALDTLYELSNALGNNENFATDILVAIANTETTNADFYSSNSTIVFTRGDTTTYDVNLSTFASSNTSTANAVLSNTTITFTRADSSTYDLDLSTLDLGSSVNTGTTPPANPAEGDMWYNTDLASLTIYLGSAWVELFAETSPAMSVSATPPTAVDGDLWFDTERVNLNVYYDGVWIELLGGGGGGGASVTIDSTPPASSNEGDLYFDDELATLYIYYGSSWVEVLPNNDTSPVEIDLDTYTANGSVSTFAYTSTASQATDLIVTVDGIVQRPTTDYTLSNQNVVFGSNPSNGSVIAIRGLQGMGQGISNTYLQSTLSNYVLTAEQVTGITYAEATSSQSANTGYKYIVDTSSTAVTITLPASASLGEEVGIMDGVGNASVNNITVARNGHNIQGSAEDLTIDVDRAAFTLVYYNATQGWLLTEV